MNRITTLGVFVCVLALSGCGFGLATDDDWTAQEAADKFEELGMSSEHLTVLEGEEENGLDTSVSFLLEATVDDRKLVEDSLGVSEDIDWLARDDQTAYAQDKWTVGDTTYFRDIEVDSSGEGLVYRIRLFTT